MKLTPSQKLKTGIFTIVGIVILVIGLVVISSNKNMLGNTFNIYGTFNNVGGLQTGNNILFAGIKVGTIENIQLIADTVIRVDMRMEDDIRPFLKKDAVATIASSGLMGDKNITIIAGSFNEAELMKEGGRISTTNPVAFDEIVTKLTKVADNAGVITTELAGMAVQIREGKGTISKLIYTDDLSRSLEASAANAAKITNSVAGITAKINAGEGTIGKLVYTTALSDQMDGLMVTADGAMLTIKEAANGFSENMKALQSNFLLKGYFKRKAREEESKEPGFQKAVDIDSTDNDLEEAELEEIIREAQKALEAKRKKTTVSKE